jgi:hypothetical protein
MDILNEKEVLMTSTGTASLIPAPVLSVPVSVSVAPVPLPPPVESSRSFDTQERKEQRRHKRRKLKRYVKRSKGFPSFVDMLEIKYDEAISSSSSESEGQQQYNGGATNTAAGTNKDQDQDRPKLVRIDVDAYLGLKVATPEKGQGSRVLIPAASSAVVSSTTANNNNNNNNHSHNSNDNAAASPVDEGWYEGSVSMFLPPDDTQYLNELQQLIRANLELFSATELDAAMSQAGRRTPTVRGKVGVRCRHCANVVAEKMKTQKQDLEYTGVHTTSLSSSSSSSLYSGKHFWPGGAVSYPLNIAGLYSVCSQKPQLHFEQCPNLPWETKAQFKNLTQDIGRGARTRRSEGGLPNSLYYVIAAKRIGLVDVKDGIRFGRDLSLDPLPFEAIKAQMDNEMPAASRSTSSFHTSNRPNAAAQEPRMTADEESERVLAEALTEADLPLKFPALGSDKQLVTDYFFMAIRQMAVCHAVPSDFSTRGKKTKLMRLGYAGFCCRHCMEPDGAPPYITDFSCRSFSSAADNLSSAISNSFTSHLQKCYKTPVRIKKALTAYKRIHQRQMAQLAYGSQRRLIHELWARLRAADRPEVVEVDEVAVASEDDAAVETRVTEMITRTATKSPQDYDFEPSSVDAAAGITEGNKDPTADATSLAVPEHPGKVEGSDEDPAPAGPASSTLAVPAVAHEENGKSVSNEMDTSSKPQEQNVQAVGSEPKL